MASTRLWNLADVGALPLSMVLMLVTWLVGLGLFLCACGERVPRVTRYLLPFALVLLVAHSIQVHDAMSRLRGGDVTTDVLIFEEYAAHLVLEGRNPYQADLLEAYRAHQTPFTFSTPSIDGSLSGRQPYPALSFLLLVPLLVLRLDASIAYPLFQIGALVVLYVWAKPRYRPVILLPFLAETSFMGDALGGVSDAVWAFLLVCMLVVWERPTGRGVLYGLAIAFKQHTWYLAPFLLARIAWETEGSRDERVRAVARFVAISGGVFLLINLPFIVWDPASWVLGVLAPVLAPMHVFGQGASVLTTVGWLTIPKTPHTIVTYGLLAVGVVAYARHAPRAPYLMWLLPGIALWFGYRSLTSYWYYLALPFALDLFGTRSSPLLDATIRRRSVLPELAVAGGLVVVFVLSAIWGAVGPQGMEIRIAGPHQVWQRQIVGTTVWVRNNTERPVEPRFQVHENNLQPFFWRIESGPEILTPGKSAVYRIGTDWPPAFVDVRRGGRVIVHPADAYEPRVATRIEGDLSIEQPSVAPNPRWRLWSRGENKPQYWDLQRTSDRGWVRYAGDGTRGAVALELPPTPGESFQQILLHTTMLVPEVPFRIDVRPPDGANVLPDPDIVYGLQLRHGPDTVWLLFGGEPAVGQFDAHHYYKVVAAPYGAWSTHEVDVRALFEEFGLHFSVERAELPEFPRLDFPMSPLEFDLMLQTRRTTERVAAEFGEMDWGEGLSDPRPRYREAAEHPEHLLVWEADYEAEMGNEDKARALYLSALALQPQLGLAHYALAELGLGGAEDVSHYVEAAESGYRPGLSFRGAGWASLRLHDPAGAERYFQQSLQLLTADGDIADATKGLALSYAARGLCEQARGAAEQARERDPGLSLELPGCEGRGVPATDGPVEGGAAP